ncbi:hypothetical protein Tco_1005132, partial [Tanacetum coccineum]
GAASPCGAKGQRPLQGQGEEPLARVPLLDTQFPSNTTLKAEFTEESLQLEIGTHCYIPRCKTKGTIYVSMKCRRFKKLGLGFLYAHEGYGHKAL